MVLSPTKRPWALALLAALSLAACSKTRPAPEDAAAATADPEPVAPELPPDPQAVKWNWTARSRDGQVTLTQSSTIARLCKFRAAKGDQELWTASVCLGNRDVAHLVSDDGERVLTVEPAPVVQGSWRAAAVISAYTRDELKAQLLASDLFADEKVLAIFPDSLQWMSGARKQPDPPPKYLEGAPDQVELSLIDGRKAVVSLDGKVLSGGKPAPKLTPKAPTRVVKKKPRPKR